MLRLTWLVVFQVRHHTSSKLYRRASFSPNFTGCLETQRNYKILPNNLFVAIVQGKQINDRNSYFKQGRKYFSPSLSESMQERGKYFYKQKRYYVQATLYNNFLQYVKVKNKHPDRNVKVKS